LQVLLGIDIGTTHCKVGVFTLEGQALQLVSRPTVATRHPQFPMQVYDPDQMWSNIVAAIQEALAPLAAPAVISVGISSMAESGLLVERSTGRPRSPFMPWFDPCSEPQAAWMKRESDAYERFVHSGLHGSFKLGLAKILWIREHVPEAFQGGDPVWLSAAGWIAYQLTGQFAFDPTLAARTYVFRIDQRDWDEAWIRHLKLPLSIFPEVVASGESMGKVKPELCSLGLSTSTEVVIAGHDHVAAALALGAISPGVVYNSMGTAETLVGTLAERPLTRNDFAAGLSFGIHLASGRYFWMGGQSSSGGSVEWMRALLGQPLLSYEEVLSLLDQVSPEPTGVLYFPYLAGSGAPLPDSKVRAAFIGLAKSHEKQDMLKAVLEGTVYQLEMMKRSAEQLNGDVIERMLVIGGGTKIQPWLKIKANITGCALQLPGIPEASVLGAALASGIGARVFHHAEEAALAVTSVVQQNMTYIYPDTAQQQQYHDLYQRGFFPLQQALRVYFNSNT
jgi:sugar (pentulose or hexulose) kinase